MACGGGGSDSAPVAQAPVAPTSQTATIQPAPQESRPASPVNTPPDNSSTAPSAAPTTPQAPATPSVPAAQVPQPVTPSLPTTETVTPPVVAPPASDPVRPPVVTPPVDVTPPVPPVVTPPVVVPPSPPEVTPPTPPVVTPSVVTPPVVTPPVVTPPVTPPVVTPPVVLPPAPIARHTIDQPDEVTGAQFHVMYVRHTNGQDAEYDTTLRNRLINSIETMNDWFARETGGRRIRFDMYRGQIEVTYVQLPFIDSELNIYQEGTFRDTSGNFKRDRIEQELRNRNLLNPNKKYLIIYQGTHSRSHTCGDAPGWDTAQPQATVMYLQTYCFSSEVDQPSASKNPVQRWNNFEMVLAHEIVHGLGAARPGAPDFAPGGHTTVYEDILYVASIDRFRTLRLDPMRRNYYNPNGPLPNGLFNIHNSPFLTTATQ